MFVVSVGLDAKELCVTKLYRNLLLGDRFFGLIRPLHLSLLDLDGGLFYTDCW